MFSKVFCVRLLPVGACIPTILACEPNVGQVLRAQVQDLLFRFLSEGDALVAFCAH